MKSARVVLISLFAWATCAISVGRASPRAAESTNDISSQRLTGTLAPQPKKNEAPRIFYHRPAQLHRFSTWKKLNPIWWFKNADDPAPPPSYRNGKCCRKFMWYVRNPFHNFDHYVIGIADKPFTRVGRFPDQVANPNGGWNWAVSRYRNLRLPFVDYHRGGFEFYIGWRNGGNFGLKLNFGQKRAATPTKGS